MQQKTQSRVREVLVFVDGEREYRYYTVQDNITVVTKKGDF